MEEEEVLEGQAPFDMNEFAQTIRTMVREEVAGATPAETEEVEAVPAEQRGAAGAQARVSAQRDLDGEDAPFLQTFRLIKAMVQKDRARMNDTQELMARAGMYDWSKAGIHYMDEERGVTTRAGHVTGSEGAPFLPTTVDSRIEEIREMFGVARRLTRVYRFNSGTHKIPNSTGRPPVFAVNEGSAIKMRKSTFGVSTLDPKKWGVISAWSEEMSEEVGVQFVNVLTEQIGRSFAEAEDQTLFTADGSATYHSLVGLLDAASGVTVYNIDAAGTDFRGMDYDDAIKALENIAASVRTGANFVFHPDMQLVFSRFKHDTGEYLFPPNQMVERLIKPVAYTEALPDLAAGALTTPFGIVGDFSYATMGIKRGISVKLLDQATIEDVDDSTLINLAQQDMLGIRYTARWDFKYALTGAWSVIST